MVSEMIGQDPANFSNPIKGCLFFAVPHKGSGTAGTFAPILQALGTFFDVGSKNVKALQRNSDRLSDIVSQFRTIRQDCNITIISCYELNRDLKQVVSWILFVRLAKGSKSVGCSPRFCHLELRSRVSSSNWHIQKPQRDSQIRSVKRSGFDQCR